MAQTLARYASTRYIGLSLIPKRFLSTTITQPPSTQPLALTRRSIFPFTHAVHPATLVPTRFTPKILGSEEEAKKKIYNVSCERYFGLGCEIDEETSNKLEGLPGVLFVLPDSFVDPEYKDYGVLNGNGHISSVQFPWRAGAVSLFFHHLRQSAAPRPFLGNNNTSTGFRNFSTGMSVTQSSIDQMKQQFLQLDINSQIGSCMPLGAMRIGTVIHNIEMKPGQGSKLVRAAGTCAKILKEPTAESCCIELPSKRKIWLDSRCRATIGVVSNPSHRTRKLRKAGQSRWLGRRPVVRGVAMNPVDHPHGGGEGKSKSSGSRGKVSRTPWGKPTKCGYGRKKRQ